VNPHLDGYTKPKSPENTPKKKKDPTENQKKTEIKI